jgi:Amt family ammonium transporter
VGLLSIVVFKLIEVTVGHRVDPKAEIDGLDIPEMGAAGYCGVKMDKYSETPVSR